MVGGWVGWWWGEGRGEGATRVEPRGARAGAQARRGRKKTVRLQAEGVWGWACAERRAALSLARPDHAAPPLPAGARCCVPPTLGGGAGRGLVLGRRLIVRRVCAYTRAPPNDGDDEPPWLCEKKDER